MDIKRVKVDVHDAIAREIIGLALDIHGILVGEPPAGTPVDTAWASANWWPTVGSPATRNSGRPDEGSVGSREAEQQAGVLQVMQYKLQNTPIYITNNVPYISRLNNGWSQQSPAGFVDRAIQTAVTRFKGK